MKNIISCIGFVLAIFFVAPILAAAGATGWPLEVAAPHGKIVVYQPQPEVLTNNVLTGRAAISVTLQDKNVPAFGAVWFSADVATDLDKRTYDLSNVKVTKVKFAVNSAAEEKEFASIIGTELPKGNLHGSLDALMVTLESAEKERQTADDLQMTPPKIIFLQYPAQLVFIDGAPKLQAIDGTKLMRVVNTPMMMVFDANDKKYYLAAGTVWYSATDVMRDWQIDHNPPSEIAKMITADGKPIQNPLLDAQMPRIIVATEPTELIVTDGSPQYSPISDTNLLYVSNSDNDVFLHIDTQVYYVLLSGRWFSSNSLTGEWNYVAPDKLPPDFAKIPPNSAKGDALVSIPNTTQAQDALIQSEIPQTAVVERSKAQLTVKYDGTPQFVKIKGTDMEYAANTATPVLLINGKYYACDNAIWFVAATPNGPWVAADAVPDEIQKIPPTCPVYNVKYVHVYSATPEVIYVGYTAGYVGWYPYYGTVVYGTGYVYPAWSGYYYYPYPATYGFAVHYNSFTDSWAFGFRWSSGFNYVAFGWNNGWGNHGWWGPGRYIYHPVYIHNDINIQRNININNVSRTWNVPGQIHVGNKTFNIDRTTVKNNIYNRSENSSRVVANRTTQSHVINRTNAAHNTANNVLIDKDGNVYRNVHNRWEKHDAGKWSEVTPAGHDQVANVQNKISQQRSSVATRSTKASERVSQQQAVTGHVPSQVLHDYQARERGAAIRSFSSFAPSAGHGLMRR